MSNDLPLVQWYPGHIAKAQRVLKERLAVIDFVIEVADARVPASSRFAEAQELIAHKPTLLVLTKRDLADPEATRYWSRLLGATPIEGRSGKGLTDVNKRLVELKAAVDAKMKNRGRMPRAARIMVLGLPNVGKSSLINRLAGKHKAKTGDRPGITRAAGWIRIGKDLELLDTPGLIPPRLDDRLIALKLAMVGAVSDGSYDPEEVAKCALLILKDEHPHALATYDGLWDLEAIAMRKGWLSAGGADLQRASRAILHDLKTGALGPLTLDRPDPATSGG